MINWEIIDDCCKKIIKEDIIDGKKICFICHDIDGKTISLIKHAPELLYALKYFVKGIDNHNLNSDVTYNYYKDLLRRIEEESNTGE